MNFLRRLFGNATDSSGGRRLSRRAAHVTPSNDRRPSAAIELEPEADSAAQSDDLSFDSPFEDEIAVTESAWPDNRAMADAPSLERATESAPLPPRDTAEQPPAGQPIRKSGPYQTLTYGIASDVGMLRDNNEDASFAMHWHSNTVDDRPDFGLFVIADGMGGHLDGEKASGLAVQVLAAEMLEKTYAPLLADYHLADSPTLLEALVSAAEKANLAVIKRVPGGGTTLSGVAIVDNLAYVAHVGDTRIYLLHNDQIEQLTTDHTLVQRLIEMNELTPEEAEFYPQKNVLYRAIGQNEQLKVERLVRKLPSSAQILICSDGLWELVEDETIKSVALDAETPQAACNRLVELANERGGIDNITVIILKTPGGAVV